MNLDAPKGGTFNFQPPNWLYNQNTQTFNTLNSFIPKGDSPPRMEMCFDSLMTAALDEPDTLYGLVAETVTLSADRNGFDFALRPEARFHDGTPLTAEDVAFTFNLFKSDGHPSLLLPLAEMVSAEALDPQTIASCLFRKAIGAHGAGRRCVPDRFQAVLHRQSLQQRRAGSATRLRSVSRRSGSRRPHDRVRPRRGLLGARTCRSTAAFTISMSSASNSTVTGKLPSKPSRRAISISARSSPREHGRPATISPPLRRARL